ESVAGKLLHQIRGVSAVTADRWGEYQDREARVPGDDRSIEKRSGLDQRKVGGGPTGERGVAITGEGAVTDLRGGIPKLDHQLALPGSDAGLRTAFVH